MDIGHLVKWRGYHREWQNAPRWQDGVWVMNPFSVVPFRDKFPFNTLWAVDSSYRFCMPSIKKQLSKVGRCSPDIIWSARPGSGILKKMFPEAFLAVQVVDYYPAFRGDYIKAIEKRDYQLADRIFLIGHALVSYLTEELGVPEEKITVLGQGVSVSQYEAETNLPAEYEEIKGLRAVWVGALEKCDPGLFGVVAQELGEFGGSLVLIGRETSWARELQGSMKNVFLLGPKKPSEVPAYLQHADIGLMLYDRTKASVYKGQNPLKLYEYAAAGLSILSTPHEEFQFLKPPVLLVSHEQEIGEALSIAIEDRNRLRQLSLDFAAGHDWEEIYQTARDEMVGGGV
ncbi:MAG: hypothetical protein ACI91V_000609 [Lentimonas sp.]|jgi:hypothetical protein